MLWGGGGEGKQAGGHHVGGVGVILGCELCLRMALTPKSGVGATQMTCATGMSFVDSSGQQIPRGDLARWLLLRGARLMLQQKQSW